MRTLFEIIESVKGNAPATDDELRYALCALDSLSTLDKISIRNIYAREMEGRKPISFDRIERIMEDSHKCWHLALNKSPKDWLGPNNDPRNPEYQKGRAVSLRIFNKAMRG